MTIPTGPFPAAIDYADLRVGMHVRVIFEYHDTGETLTFDVFVNRIDANGAYVRTADLQIANPITWDDTTRDETIYLLEEFTGDPDEPTTSTVVMAADGTVYQRAADATDPTASTWYTTNSTTAVTWSDITAAGATTILLDGSTL